MQNKTNSISLYSVYLLGFLFSFNAALTAYIDSSFLKQYVSTKYIGSIFTITYLLVIFGFFLMPFALKKLGNFKTTLILVITELLALAGLAFLPSSPWLIILLVINLVIIYLLYFPIDIFLENYSSNKRTGVLRGIYLTSINFAWLLSQLIIGGILVNNEYQNIYLASFIILLPFVLILTLFQRNFNDTAYQTADIWQTVKSVWQNKNIFNIFMSNFLLYFFYGWMIIYTPLYLNEYLGFTWLEIGKIFFIMLLPFVFIQYPLGYLADKKCGEKEILSIGFIIMAISTGIISFISNGGLMLWAVLLFITRIGAGMVEVMSNIYFFKKVDSLNANIIGFFRVSGPLAYIVGSLVATILLNLFSFDIKALYIVLGVIMLLGLRFSLAIEDTK